AEFGQLRARSRMAGEPVELEIDVGQALGETVMEIARQSIALSLGAECAEPVEPEAVVDGEGQRFGQAIEYVGVPGVEGDRFDPLEGDEGDEMASGDQGCVEAAPR